MADPKLRIKASGYGGSGYFQPFTGEKVIGVTTALGVIDKPGLRQYMVNQTVAYMAYRAKEYADMEPEQIYNSGRWYHTRHKDTDFDDPYYDAKNAHAGVTGDAADRGTKLHDFMEAELNDWLHPDLYHDEEVQMAEQLLIWLAENDVTVLATEATVFGATSLGFGWGGTCDLYGIVNGKVTALDLKTGRGLYDTHTAQLAALGAAHTMAVQVPEGTPGAIRYERTQDKKKVVDFWLPAEVPPVEQYAVLHLRPDDYNDHGVLTPAFCEMHIVPQVQIDKAWDMFEGSVWLRHTQRELNQLKKQQEKEEVSVF